MATALLLLRSPFQAWLADLVLEAEGIDEYDIIYVTRNDSEEDRYYFEQLQRRASQAHYSLIGRARIDFIQVWGRQLELTSITKNKCYDVIVFASINDFVFAWATVHHRGAALVTLDDGAANYVERGIYAQEPLSWRGHLFRSILGVPSYRTIKNEIVRHYTLHPDLPNIVDKQRLRQISTHVRASEAPKNNEMWFFIGAPFDEVMSPEQLNRFRSCVEQNWIDYYVEHPREKTPILEVPPRLTKQGRIAEEAIIATAGGSRIVLVGWLSTVMFNLSGPDVRKIVVLPQDSSDIIKLSALAKRIGCEIVAI